jgi:hypothetical protein
LRLLRGLGIVMNNLVHIHSIGLDKDIIVPLLNDDLICHTVGSHNTDCMICVGYNERSANINGYDTTRYWDKQPNYIFIEDTTRWKFFSWMSGGTLVRLGAPEVKYPNQKCSGCGLPAPHKDPNVGDKFLCVGCKFLSELG